MKKQNGKPVMYKVSYIKQVEMGQFSNLYHKVNKTSIIIFQATFVIFSLIATSGKSQATSTPINLFACVPYTRSLRPWKLSCF